MNKIETKLIISDIFWPLPWECNFGQEYTSHAYVANLMPTKVTKAYPNTMGWIEIFFSRVLTRFILLLG